MASGFRDGFVIVRDGADGAFYLHVDGAWASSSDGARTFSSRLAAKQWIQRRPLGYWLTEDLGRPRIITARAAGMR